MSIFGKPILTGVGKGSVSGAVASFSDGAKGLPLKSLLVAIEPVQEGTGDPSPDNVRPISGWSEVNVWRTGANVWDEEWEVGTFLNTNGTKYPSTAKIRSKNPISVKANTTYYYYVGSTSADEDRIWCYDADMNFIRSFSYIHQTSIGATFTTPANCSYINFAIKNTHYNHDISINYPSTDHDYHPYSGNQYTIQLGQTVYGGTFDVKNGVLTVDRAMVDLGMANWTATGATGRTRIDSVVSAMTAFSGKIPAYKSNFLCSNYKNGGLQDYTYTTNGEVYYTNGTPSTPGNNLIRINDIGMANMSASEVKAYLSGVQLVYELATPITIPLTPTQISTLQKQNNVWADSGDITVEYLKQSLKYIGSYIR